MRPETANPTPASGWLARRRAAAGSKQELIALQVREPKRRHSRHATRNLQIESPVYGWVVDVSESGLCLETLTAPVSGGRFLFRLRYGATFLNLPGRVVWSRLERTERSRKGSVRIYRAGVELATDGGDRAWIRAIERLTGASLGL